MAAIKATPTDGLCYNPSKELYWDEDALDKELERVFDICHGCRMCFNLCPSFPALFDAVDRHDGDVRKLTAADERAVADACYQCKLCYVKCPYTADDGHEFDLDFPRLMLRYNAQRVRREGIKPREKLLGNPMRLGRTGPNGAGVANWANRTRAGRIVMEKTLGIHRDKLLPEYSKQTFERWMSARPALADADEEIAFFHTCFVNFHAAELGRDAVGVLERSRIRVATVAQTCCGMPALDGGDVDFARRQARENVKALLPFAAAGKKVVAVNPTCSYTLKKEYPELVGSDMEEDARTVAAATRDLCEFLSELRRAKRLDRTFRSTPGEIAYHLPCHLKAQNIGLRSREVMKTIPDAEVRVVERCCGHDGTWAMKTENFERSLEIGRPAFEELREGGLMTTDCPLAAIQIEQATGVRPLHPVQVLARAYEPGGFARRVEASDAAEGEST